MIDSLVLTESGLMTCKWKYKFRETFPVVRVQFRRESQATLREDTWVTQTKHVRILPPHSFAYRNYFENNYGDSHSLAARKLIAAKQTEAAKVSIGSSWLQKYHTPIEGNESWSLITRCLGLMRWLSR